MGAAAAHDEQLADMLWRLRAEAAVLPSLGALRPSEREGPLWLAGEVLWAVLRDGLLGLFRTDTGLAPDDLAAQRGGGMKRALSLAPAPSSVLAIRSQPGPWPWLRPWLWP